MIRSGELPYIFSRYRGWVRDGVKTALHYTAMRSATTSQEVSVSPGFRPLLSPPIYPCPWEDSSLHSRPRSPSLLRNASEETSQIWSSVERNCEGCSVVERRVGSVSYTTANQARLQEKLQVTNGAGDRGKREDIDCLTHGDGGCCLDGPRCYQ